MPKKYLIAAAGAGALAVALVVSALFARRTRREPPPVSATVPRIEEVSAVGTGHDASQAS